MIQRQLELRLNARQEGQLTDWLYHLTGVWNWAIRKIELDAKDGIFYTPQAFHNLLANHSAKLGLPSHTLQGMLSTAYTAWQRCFQKRAKRPKPKGQRNKPTSIPFPDPFRAPERTMPKPTPRVIDVQAMIADYNAGLSIQALSKTYHTHLRRITRELKSASVVLRTQGPQPRLWIGRPHSLDARMKMSAAKRAVQKAHATSSYRDKRQTAFCPKTGLGERAWVRLQLRKANYTCQVTGKRGVKLVVHHLFSVSTHPHLRWNATNIVVVQKTLHDQFHHTYMKGCTKPCTPDDWHTFLKQCADCGSVHDHDVNAALNTLYAGVGMPLESHRKVASGIL